MFYCIIAKVFPTLHIFQTFCHQGVCPAYQRLT